MSEKLSGTILITVIIMLTIAVSGQYAAKAATLTVPGQYATIQAAVDNAQAGDNIVIHTGVYRQAVLILNKNTIGITGTGKRKTILDGFGIVIKNCNNIVVRNLTIRNTWAKSGVRPKVRNGGIRIENSRAMIDDCHLTKVNSNGIYISGKSICIVSNCVAEHCRLNGLQSYDAGTAVTIKKCTFNNNRYEGIELRSKSKGIIEDCTFYKNRDCGCFVANLGVATIVRNNVSYQNGQGISCGQSTSDKKKFTPTEAQYDTVNELLLENNQCRNNRYVGIYVEKAGIKVRIVGNHCHGNKHVNIHIANSAFVSCENNICQSGEAGILFYGKGSDKIKVTGNKCNYNRRMGILLKQCGQTEVRDNRCEGNGTDGITATETCKPQTIIHNTLINNIKDGIWCGDTKGLTVTDNKTTGNLYGIVIKSVTGPTVVSGNIIRNNRNYGITYFQSKNGGTIADNTCSQNGWGGIELYLDNIKSNNNKPGITITDNICCDNFGAGICLTECRGNFLLKNNRASNNAYMGIVICSGSVELRGDNCDNNGQEGIVVAGNETGYKVNVNVHDTNCTGNNASGILFVQGASGIIKNNKCSGHPWAGIAVRGTNTSADIAGNNCSHNGTWGIISWAGAQTKIADDNITQYNGKGGTKELEGYGIDLYK